MTVICFTVFVGLCLQNLTFYERRGKVCLIIWRNCILCMLKVLCILSPNTKCITDDINETTHSSITNANNNIFRVKFLPSTIFCYKALSIQLQKYEKFCFLLCKMILWKNTFGDIHKAVTSLIHENFSKSCYYLGGIAFLLFLRRNLT